MSPRSSPAPKSVSGLAEASLEATVAVHGPEHPRVAAQGLLRQRLGLGEVAERELDPRQVVGVVAGRDGLRPVDLHAHGEGATERARRAVEVALPLGDDAQVVELGVRERLVGPEHPHVATSLETLALIRREQGRPDESRALHLRSLALREKTGGPDDERLVNPLLGLGWLDDDAGDAAAALREFRRALAIREKASGADNPSTAIARAAVAWALSGLGRCAEAGPLVATTLARYEVKAAAHEAGFVALLAQGRCELAAGQAAPATATLGRALAVAESHLLPAARGSARALLARSLWAAGRRAEAVAAATQAAEELASSARAVRELRDVRAWLAAHD